MWLVEQCILESNEILRKDPFNIPGSSSNRWDGIKSYRWWLSHWGILTASYDHVKTTGMNYTLSYSPEYSCIPNLKESKTNFSMVGLHGRMSVVSKVELASQWRWTLQKVSMLAPPFIFSRKDFCNKSPGKIAHIEICLSIVIYAISKFSTISCRQDDKEARLILNITTIVLYPPLKSENCFYCVAYLSIRLTS